MRDTRLTNMRECLAEAVTATDKQVRYLITDCQKLISELDDDGVRELHDRVDLAQVAVHLKSALTYVQSATRLMESASRELWHMESRS